MISCQEDMELGALFAGAAFTWKGKMLAVHVPDARMAFVMNVSVSLLIAKCSVFCLFPRRSCQGRLHRALSILGETEVVQQYMGFFVCMSCVFFWSYSGINPRAPSVQLFHSSCDFDLWLSC